MFALYLITVVSLFFGYVAYVAAFKSVEWLCFEVNKWERRYGNLWEVIEHNGR